MESVDAGIFFDQMMADLSEGNLSRKTEMVQFFKRYDGNPNATKTTVMQTWLNYVLVDACKKGHLNIVQFVLSSPELPLHADIHFNKGTCLSAASEHNHFPIIKYLLTSPELKEHANIHAKNDEALTSACRVGNLEIVKYLTSSSELKEHSYIHAYNDSPFMEAAYNQRLDIIKYLIFDLKMELTLNIHELFEKQQFSDLKEQVYEWVKVRNFKNLVEDLPINEEKVKARVKL